MYDVLSRARAAKAFNLPFFCLGWTPNNKFRRQPNRLCLSTGDLMWLRNHSIWYDVLIGPFFWGLSLVHRVGAQIPVANAERYAFC